jgi:DNA polymerase-3 subunit epsilon
MAHALLGERSEFVREVDGRWRLADRSPAPYAVDVAPRYQAPIIAHPDLLSLDYAVVDVETTGTRCWAGDRITEIAVVAVRGGIVAETFETLVNPERPIPPWISRLTNISWDMVKDAPRFRDICDAVVRAMDGAIFVAHNAQFDWRFVTTEVERATGRQLDGRRLCTVRLARKLLPQLRSRRLDYLALHYGVNITARHRAGGDAAATAEILVRLLRDARSRECHCWPDLEALLGRMLVRSRKRRRSAMPRPVDRDTTA